MSNLCNTARAADRQFPSLQDMSLILNVMQSVIQKIIMYFMDTRRTHVDRDSRALPVIRGVMEGWTTSLLKQIYASNICTSNHVLSSDS